MVCKGSATHPWGLGLPSNCLKVVLIYFIPLFTSQTLLIGMCQDSLGAGCEDQGTTQGSRGNVWPGLHVGVTFQGKNCVNCGKYPT